MFGVCKKIIRKLTDYFFMVLDLETASFVNGSLFTQLKENTALIKHFWPIYIDFDDYPPYGDKISDFLKQMLMLIFSVNVDTIILQANRKCTRGLIRKVGKC